MLRQCQQQNETYSGTGKQPRDAGTLTRKKRYTPVLAPETDPSGRETPQGSSLEDVILKGSPTTDNSRSRHKRDKFDHQDSFQESCDNDDSDDESSGSDAILDSTLDEQMDVEDIDIPFPHHTTTDYDRLVKAVTEDVQRTYHCNNPLLPQKVASAIRTYTAAGKMSRSKMRNDNLIEGLMGETDIVIASHDIHAILHQQWENIQVKNQRNATTRQQKTEAAKLDAQRAINKLRQLEQQEVAIEDEFDKRRHDLPQNRATSALTGQRHSASPTSASPGLPHHPTTSTPNPTEIADVNDQPMAIDTDDAQHTETEHSITTELQNIQHIADSTIQGWIPGADAFWPNILPGETFGPFVPRFRFPDCDDDFDVTIIPFLQNNAVANAAYEDIIAYYKGQQKFDTAKTISTAPIQQQRDALNREFYQWNLTGQFEQENAPPGITLVPWTREKRHRQYIKCMVNVMRHISECALEDIDRKFLIHVLAHPIDTTTKQTTPLSNTRLEVTDTTGQNIHQWTAAHTQALDNELTVQNVAIQHAYTKLTLLHGNEASVAMRLQLAASANIAMDPEQAILFPGIPITPKPPTPVRGHNIQQIEDADIEEADEHLQRMD